MKYRITALIVIVCAGLIWFGSSRITSTGDKTDLSVVDNQTEDSMTSYLDRIDTDGFSSTQLKVLTVLREEYVKNPVEFDDTILAYTEGFEESWCADFLSWVFNEADTPFTHPDTGYWRIPGVLTLQAYYEQQDAYHDIGEYTPVFGDVAFYFGETPDGSSAEHVAMVLAVEGDTIITIGGNETDKGIIQIRTDTLREGEKGLSGFGASAI